MKIDRSLYGPVSGRRPKPTPPRGRSASIKLIVACVFIAGLILVPAVLSLRSNEIGLPARGLAQNVIPGFQLNWQFKDTVMPCQICGGAIHAWNHVKGPDPIYGNMNDCPHCSCYCAPASISMIAAFRLKGVPFTNQDDIYDVGELEIAAGENPGDNIIQKERVGMCDGTGGFPQEVQTAFTWSLGRPIIQYDWWGTNLTMTPEILQDKIGTWHPILWLDHSGWPVNMSQFMMETEYRGVEGHAKVITGYDDGGTADYADDRCLIYDPWPEYTDLNILPVNATRGPGNSADPYWLPLNDVNLSDKNDLFIVDTLADIPEFGNVLIPTVGTLAVALVAIRRRLR